MDANLYNDKYRLLIRNLHTHTQFASNPVKFNGVAQGQQFLHYTPEQCKNILEHLQDEDRVLKILRYKSPTKPDSPLDDGNYYFLEIFPEFEPFANRVLKHQEASSSSKKLELPLRERPHYQKQKNTLLIQDQELSVKYDTIEGIILDILLNRPNQKVEILTIENTYKNLHQLGSSYTLESDDLHRKIKALNQKVRRKLQTKIGLLSVKGEYVHLNHNFVTKEKD